MSTETRTAPTLRDIILDAIEDAFWYRRAQVEDCGACSRNPAGICGDHQADNDLGALYEDARKHLQRSPGSPEVAALLGTADSTEGGGQ